MLHRDEPGCGGAHLTRGRARDTRAATAESARADPGVGSCGAEAEDQPPRIAAAVFSAVQYFTVTGTVRDDVLSGVHTDVTVNVWSPNGTPLRVTVPTHE